MHSYSVGVAIFDFVPVLMTAVALGLLARAISARHGALAVVAWAATALVLAGGLCKASWKLIVALEQREIPWLENMLFIAMAPGFIALSFSMFHARRAWVSGQPPISATFSKLHLLLWLAAPLAIAAIAAILRPDSRLWFFWLLAVTATANAALLVQAVMAARAGRLGWPVHACFAYNFAATLALSGLARLPPGEYTAWIQEGVNFSAQAALAGGLLPLSRRMYRSL